MLTNWAGYILSLVYIFEGILVVLVGYLFILTLAALFAPRRTSLPTLYTPHTRFAILVPAHNEERLLPELLSSLHAQNYPDHLFDVFIVADNCSDRTADIGRATRAYVYDRQNNHQVGKGYALNWLYKQIETDGMAHDYTAFIIFDADTIVDAHFLRVMDARLQAGETAIQGYYSVRDLGQSWGTALRYAALAVLHYLRPLGRNLLRGTAGLKGNGMCFSANVYHSHEWSSSVTEDIEYHMGLVQAGDRVTFAPDACLAAEMPGTLNRAYTQNRRWESGRLEMVRKYTFPLIKTAFLEHRFPAFDALMEHIIPPTALLVLGILGAITLGSIIGLLSGSWAGLWIGFILLAAFSVYLGVGLKLVQAPRQVWLALLFAPQYMLWKIGMILRIRAGNEPRRWVRTSR